MTKPIAKPDSAPALSHKQKVEEDVRRLLSGTHTSDVAPEVSEAHALSRSNQFAADEDIKHCNSEIVYQASPPVLVEAALQNEKGSFLTATGALSVRSGAKTGRSPKDKRVVVEPGSEANVWWGPVNIKLNEQSYMINRERAIDYLNTRERIYVVDGYAGWDPAFRVRVRVICVRAYHALFMRNMLVVPPEEDLVDFVPDMIIFNAGGFPAVCRPPL